jgi:adenylosuccinate synthase
VPVSFDLAELRGYHYHSGVVFDAYCDGASAAVARGGRYDEVGKAFGRARPATGFSIDLRTLASLKANGKKKAEMSARNVVVIGTQWGDEGKGKIVDWLTDRAQGVVRFQGGHNAGHTLVIGGKKTVLHLIPSASCAATVDLLHRQRRGALARGPARGDGRARAGRRAQRRGAAHRLGGLPADPAVSRRAVDRAREAAKGEKKIGTTGRGIGPAYEDKVARRAIRLQDLMHPERFERKLEELLDFHNFVLQNYYKQPKVDFRKTARRNPGPRAALVPLIADVPRAL